MKNFITIISIFNILFIFACSSSQETTNNGEAGEEEIYIFDDPVTDVAEESDTVAASEVPKDTVNYVRDDFPEVETTSTAPESYFIVQVGAFTTKEKADTFVKENQKEITYPMEVTYSSKVNLFVVWLPKFTSREEAESVRNNLWIKEKFKDAFILTVQ